MSKETKILLNEAVPPGPDQGSKDKRQEIKSDENSDVEKAIDDLDTVEMSEEFKNKLKTIFETAVNDRVRNIREELETEYENAIEESVAAVVNDLSENLSTYLDYVVEKWLEANKVNVETNYKVRMAESILEGVKELAGKHNMKIDESHEDEIRAMEEKLESMTANYDGLFEEFVKKDETIKEFQIKLAITELSEGMTTSDAARFAALAEGISFRSEEQLMEKLTVIKESYFTETVTKTKDLTEPLTEETSSKKIDGVDPSVAQYLTAFKNLTNV